MGDADAPGVFDPAQPWSHILERGVGVRSQPGAAAVEYHELRSRWFSLPEVGTQPPWRAQPRSHILSILLIL